MRVPARSSRRPSDHTVRRAQRWGVGATHFCPSPGVLVVQSLSSRVRGGKCPAAQESPATCNGYYLEGPHAVAEQLLKSPCDSLGAQQCSVADSGRLWPVRQAQVMQATKQCPQGQLKGLPPRCLVMEADELALNINVTFSQKATYLCPTPYEGS